MSLKNTRAKKKKYTAINLSSLLFKLPKIWHPYISLCRFDKPLSIFLLFWPCVWGLSLGSFPNLPALNDIILFFIGAILMRAAGCCLNDIIDRNIDAQVKRTASRPLATGAISISNAYITFFVLLILSFLILVQYNSTVIFVGISSLILVLLYPYMKRITYWPQLFLGFAFNWGILLGFFVYPHTWSWSLFFAVLFTYISGIFWTLSYDTIYAHQDKEDDAIVGIKSLALKMKYHSRYFVVMCYIGQLTLLFYAGSFIKFGWLYNLCCLAAILLQITNLRGISFDNPQQMLAAFKKHALTGGIISLAFLSG